MLVPPFKGDGFMHCAVPDGRALPRCGYPDGQNAVEMEPATVFVQYPEDQQCTERPDGSDGCALMLAAGEPGPAEWPS